MAPNNPRALGATVVVAVLVTAGLVAALPNHRAAVAQQAVHSAQQTLVLSGNPFSPACTGVAVAASDDDAAALEPLLAAYDASSPQLNGRCVQVRVVVIAPGQMAALLAKPWDSHANGPEPTVWLPGSSLWINLVRAADASPVLLDTAPSLSQTPMVIGMPRPMAEALGWPSTEIGFSDLAAIALDPRGWGKVGHPEWGALQLGKTSPMTSTTGLQALVAAYFAATGTTADLTSDNLADPKVQAFVHGVEMATVHYGTSTSSFLSALKAADAAGQGLGYVSAVALDERQVVDYDAGHPKVPLVAVYPKEGTLVSDNPFAVLSSASSDQKAAAADLLRFLQAPAQQAALQAAGYRDPQGRATSELGASGVVLADHPKAVVKSPPSSVLAQLQASWWKLRKPARVLVIVDISGSMADAVQGTGHTKLDLVKLALSAAIEQVGDADEVGLWTFSDSLDRVQEPAPMGGTRAALLGDVSSMRAGGSTALYSAVDQAIKSEPPAPGYVSAIVVLTDGQDNASNLTLDQLLAEERARPPAGATRIFTIAYGTDADRGVLSRIAAASSATSYDASNPALISEVFNDLVANF